MLPWYNSYEYSTIKISIYSSRRIYKMSHFFLFAGILRFLDFFLEYLSAFGDSRSLCECNLINPK